MWPQWNSMLSAGQWALVALVPLAILALYFLKLRRQPLVVPSTLLWQRTVEDLRVNSLWQRLRKSLLLLLQLLLAALLMLALMRPTWSGERLTQARYVFLIDQSASMAATDVAPSRLEAAKLEVARMIDALDSHSAAMIVSFSDTARVVQPFTHNRQELRRALSRIEVTDRRSNPAEAFRLVAGIGATGPGATAGADSPGADVMGTADATTDATADAGATADTTTNGAAATDSAAADATTGAPQRPVVYLVSDGQLGPIPQDLLAGLRPRFVRVGSAEAANVAIVALHATRSEADPNQLQAFCRVENFSTSPVTVNVELWLDAALLDVQQMALPARGTQATAFDLDDLASGILSVQLELPEESTGTANRLTIDDQAWVVVEPSRRAQVLLVTSVPQHPLALALSTSRAKQLANVRLEPPAFLATEEYRLAAQRGTWDLIVCDRCAPTEAPQANLFLVAALPPVGQWEQAAEQPGPQILDVETTHPLLQSLNLGDVLIAAANPLKVPRGGRVLVDTTVGPLLAIAPREEFEDLVLGCEIVGDKGIGTNWPIRSSWPGFVYNTLDYLGNSHLRQAQGELRPGDTAWLRLETPAQQVTVVDPADNRQPLLRDSRGVFAFAETDRVGIYRVESGESPLARFAVNLLDGQESDLAACWDEAALPDDVSIVGQGSWEATRHELWKLLALAALAILLFEWYIYNRRVYV